MPRVTRSGRRRNNPPAEPTGPVRAPWHAATDWPVTWNKPKPKPAKEVFVEKLDSKEAGFVRGSPRKSPKTGRFYSVLLPIQCTVAEIKSRIRLKSTLTTASDQYDVAYGKGGGRRHAVSKYKELKGACAQAKGLWCKDFTATAESQHKGAAFSNLVAVIRAERLQMRQMETVREVTVGVYFPHIDGLSGRYVPFVWGTPTRIKYTGLSSTTVLSDRLSNARACRRSVKAESGRPTRARPATEKQAHLGMMHDPRPNGLNHVQDGFFLKEAHQRGKRILVTAKVPGVISMGRGSDFVGVEVECFSNVHRDSLSSLLRKAGLHRHVHPANDGSIHPPNPTQQGVEIRVLGQEREIGQIIRDLCSVLKEADAKVNRSCGLHVHLDMRGREPENCYRRLYIALDLLYAMVPLPRRSNQRYCARNVYSDLLSQQQTRNRYVAINAESLGRHNTLECRLHSGTTSADKINNWIEILTSIVRGPTLKRLPKSTKVMAKIWGWSPDLLRYVNTRVSLFDDGTKLPFKVAGEGGTSCESEAGEEADTFSAPPPQTGHLAETPLPPTTQSSTFPLYRSTYAGLPVFQLSSSGSANQLAYRGCQCFTCMTHREPCRQSTLHWATRHQNGVTQLVLLYT